MSFRGRLTSFFILIVVVPMIAVAFLVFRLINDSEQGKANARANGVLSAAVGVYQNASVAASADARMIARELSAQSGGSPLSPGEARGTVATIAAQSGLARVVVRTGSRTLASVGDPTAIAPGTATILTRRLSVVASELTAGQYVRELAVPGAAVLVREAGRLLAVRGMNLAGQSVPAKGTVAVHAVNYRALSQALPGFGSSPVEVTVLADVSATSGSTTGSRAVALAFIVGFLVLALSFAVLASRGLQGQLSRFLLAARRLASGDFSSPIRIEGRDEFAALGQEFNNMSSQLEQRLDELSQERVRLREAIRRIGQTFASNLDRPALLDLALKTAIDGVRATGGRISISEAAGASPSEAVREGSLEHAETAIYEADRRALDSGDVAESAADHHHAMSIPLVSQKERGRSHGLITVVGGENPFSDDDRELLRSLAAQATLALENVDLHL
jgi:HAMP domain-containing protein